MEDYKQWVKGSIVECTIGGASFTKGNRYTLREDVDPLNNNNYSNGWQLDFMNDDRGKPNGWSSANFKLVQSATEPTQIYKIDAFGESAIDTPSNESMTDLSGTSGTSPDISWIKNKPQPTMADPFAMATPKTLWKNPKVTKRNKIANLKIGQMVVVSGYPIPQYVESIGNDGKIEITDAPDKYLDVDMVYPMFEKTETPSMGDIVRNARKEYGVVSRAVIGSNLELKVAGDIVNTHQGEIDKTYGFTPITKEVNSYECGTIIYKAVEYINEKALQTAYPDIIFEIVSKDWSLSLNAISKHYSIAIEKLKPKEDEIANLLSIALDHPLNVENKEWALLVGESGSGKTELAIAYAKAAGKEHILLTCSAQTTVDDFVGWKSVVDGKYISSLLREAVEYGKILICDEIDACNSNSLLVLNSLKQEYFQFPDKSIKIHKDFRLVGTANTLEYNEQYNARSPMDKATIARFDVIPYNLTGHELAIRHGLEYIKQLKVDGLTPRDVQRLVTKIKIKETT